MGRPLEFDREQALDVAMRMFWSKGYKATSLQDLLRAMNLSKSSFYQSYGSKHALFQRSIRHYRKAVAAVMHAQLEQAASGRHFIEEVFNETATDTQAADQQWGCFVMNCASEFGQSDVVIANLVMEGMLQFEDVFHRAVERAQKEGDISPEKDARALARYLVSSRSGLKTMVKAGVKPDALREIIALVQAAIG